MSVWDDLVGQEAAVAVLRGAVADPGAMTHAWLLTGPPGSGRSNAARAFAAALLCPRGGCGECHECTTALAGTHADVEVVATEATILRRQDVEPLVQLAQRSPSGGRWRVIVIEDADRLNETSGNVLLKAIEEPPPRTVWVLCAPSPQDVLVTIRSRSRSVVLRVPPVDAVARLLVERDGVEPELADAVAHASQSHIGLARRLARDPEARARRREVLDLARRIRGVPDAVLAAGNLVEVAQAEAKASTEERDADEKSRLYRALGAEEGKPLPPALRSQLKSLEEEQKRRATRAQRDVLDRAMTDLLSLYRDVLLVQLGAADGASGGPGIDLVNVELADAVRTLAADSTPEQTLRRMDAIGTARERLAANVAPLLAVEAMAVALRPQG
ncbi:DNA polymerase III subunit delta' [Luteimicrobium xylanilyticum]|uniref:DNA-directed DNA polymerase n=1 Tax=Luteimicrobium xylanilyticum TaxID=1133546 RepID=A0A5P9Q9G8_9MICO|nr:DNA polymerase III subunit delta' [Luteimicrobium xylanilyticum]QFU97055.1 DNA-directed DNA polymerase [Luteimicrobium xylanilyticum]